MAARNAQTVISQQVDALLTQLNPSVELVVVDDASQDNTAAIVAAFASPHITLIKLPQRVGTSAAKNVGVAAAVGEVLLFCDADDVVDGQWVTRLSETVEGRDIYASESSFSRLNSVEQRAWYGRHEGPYGVRRCGGRFQYATGAGMGVTRALYEELGGFDEAFTRAHDDVDFCFRGQRVGARLSAASGAVVHRRLRKTRFEMLSQQSAYAQSHKMFVTKHRLGSTGVLHDAWLRVIFTFPASMRSDASRARWLRTTAWALGLTRGVA